MHLITYADHCFASEIAKQSCTHERTEPDPEVFVSKTPVSQLTRTMDRESPSHAKRTDSKVRQRITRDSRRVTTGGTDGRTGQSGGATRRNVTGNQPAPNSPRHSSRGIKPQSGALARIHDADDGASPLFASRERPVAGGRDASSSFSAANVQAVNQADTPVYQPGPQPTIGASSAESTAGIILPPDASADPANPTD